QWLDPAATNPRMVLDFLFGQIAMAQGRAGEAAAWYRSGRELARRHFLNDPRLTVLGEVLIRELDLERNRVVVDGEVPQIPKEFWTSGSQLASYAAASSVAAELALTLRGSDDAVSLINAMLEHVHQAGLTAMVRYLCALRTQVLADTGRVAEAESSWSQAGLPDQSAGCLDLRNQSWREMEVLSCTRLRLLIASRNFGAGRRLLDGLLSLTSRRGLRRTQMRALALAMTLEESTGDRTAALDRLKAFLTLFADSGYARALIRERDAAVPVLTAFLDAYPQSPHRESANTLLAASQSGDVLPVPTLSPRESDILQRLPTQTYQQIAATLGLSRDGVRYHMRRLFDKLQVRDRNAVVHRARVLGLLPYDR
ncbi:MAG: LuxR C-terminal-related transcriptional regulator, partial [Gammaproteobacteria bacterium]|nr:LuxR C-terminal-related transcriptional regulator [Gammaproteobacteria bacterium]